MTNPHLDRALVLVEQNRWQLAEGELRQVLAADPEDAYAHALLALCLCERKEFKAATEEASQAIHLAPDFAYAHFVRARIMSMRNRAGEALEASREAIRLDPSDANYAAGEAGILFGESRWSEALEAAERGLRLDAEHVGCANLRAMSLQKLGRRTEASDTLQSALARDPENDLTHANRGWALLEAGKTDEALKHFQEALRLDPGNEWARHGVIAALKSRHAIYAMFLKYAFFMSRLGSSAQWAIIIGGYIGIRMLSSAARANPELAPWVFPIQILYISFALLSWTADPLFNLLLRLNRVGRLALTPEQVVASNWVGACVGLALLSVVGGAVSGWGGGWLMSALVFGALIIPLAGTFRCPVGWPRRTMAGYTALMALCGLIPVMSFWVSAIGREANGSLLGLFFIGFLASGWVANILAGQRVRK